MLSCACSHGVLAQSYTSSFGGSRFDLQVFPTLKFGSKKKVRNSISSLSLDLYGLESQLRVLWIAY